MQKQTTANAKNIKEEPAEASHDPPSFKDHSYAPQATENATLGESRDTGRKESDPQRKQVPAGEDTWRRCRF